MCMADGRECACAGGWKRVHMRMADERDCRVPPVTTSSSPPSPQLRQLVLLLVATALTPPASPGPLASLAPLALALTLAPVVVVVGFGGSPLAVVYQKVAVCG